MATISLNNVKIPGAFGTCITAAFTINSEHKGNALVDSGADISFISPRIVEKYGIPYQGKDTPNRIRLADGTAPGYGEGLIHLETKPMNLTVAGKTMLVQMDITDIGQSDVIL
jgi:hypothetical protein